MQIIASIQVIRFDDKLTSTTANIATSYFDLATQKNEYDSVNPPNTRKTSHEIYVELRKYAKLTCFKALLNSLPV